MRVVVNQTDSTGQPTVSEFTVFWDDERRVIDVASTGTTENLSDDLAEHLLESPQYDVSPYETDDADVEGEEIATDEESG